MSGRRENVYDTMTKRDPATEAGKTFDLLWPGGMSAIDRLSWRERILAIESEARQAAEARADAAEEALRNLANDWEADANRRRALDKASTTRAHEAANLLAEGICRSHAAAARAVLDAKGTEPR